MFSQTTAVAVRVLRQLSRDRRFLAMSIAVPLVIIYMLYLFFEAAERPFFDVQTFILPVGAFIVHFVTYILCAIVLVRERTADTLARMFVSGYRRGSIISGYVLAYSLLATLQSLIVLVELVVLFDLGHSFGTMVEIYVVMWLLAVISIALGILVSNFARNEGQVFPFIPLVLMPSVFFSGMLLPVEDLPAWVSYLSITTPMYYAHEAIGDFTTSTTPTILLGLVMYGVVILSLATFTLRERD